METKDLLNKKGYISKSTFSFLEKKIKQNPRKANLYLSAIADLIRFNTLLSVARAGTGHLGASLSIIELLAEIYFRSFDITTKNISSKKRDIIILSKGHGVPSLYATLAAKGFFPIEKLDSLRRLNGLPGHPDIKIAGVEANTGSLGMGLSKAIGYAIAKKRMKLGGNVVVIVGDGELQEGQCWESLLSAASFKCDNLYIVVDSNKVQTDQYTDKIVSFSEVVKAIRALGFHSIETNGTQVGSIYKAFNKLKKLTLKPKLLYLHTIKGQGVSFMEHPYVLRNDKDYYIWHSQVPDRKQLKKALLEIIERISDVILSKNSSCKVCRCTPCRRNGKWDLGLSLKNIPIEPIQKDILGDNLIVGFSKTLVKLSQKYKKIVVLDADLEVDCGFSNFKKQFPKRFLEMGIMEQHMSSVASAIACLGYIPVFSSYAAFLTSRANEQLYNLASERGKAIIVGNMSGVIPATPGKSHQGFRDIACIKNIPGIFMYQPITKKDVENILLRYFQEELGNILYLRLSISSSASHLPTPRKNLKKGLFQIVKSGKDIIIAGIGPVIIGECVKAAEKLQSKGINAEIWNCPWLVDFDRKSFLKASKRNIPLVIIEDHFVKGGFGESLLSFLQKNNISFKKIKHIALCDFPETGFRQEALKYLRLDSNSISNIVYQILNIK